MRYRVAVMLALFTILGMAFHGGFQTLHWNYLLALVVLVSVYVSATSFNDLADEQIDKINHAGRPGRLLVSGEASRRDVAIVGIAASAIMLLCGWLIAPAAAILALGALVINIVYSLPPLRLSYRTISAPIILALAYVVIPYLLGVVLAGGRLGRSDALFAGGLYLLFLARINLKDFRDRAGDAKFHKPTLLLRYGKPITVTVSQITLWLGLFLTAQALQPRWLADLLAGAYGLQISWLLVRLAATLPGLHEQVVIGVAAKIGNGLLLSLLALLLLTTASASVWIIALVLAMVLIASVANFKYLGQDPQDVIASYRG